VIPKSLRDRLNMGCGRPVEFWVDGDSLVLTAGEQACVICGSAGDLLPFRGRHVCIQCAAGIAAALGGAGDRAEAAGGG
jgi:transcriptional pleiotropic regulator of transition state genes